MQEHPKFWLSSFVKTQFNKKKRGGGAAGYLVQKKSKILGGQTLLADEVAGRSKISQAVNSILFDLHHKGISIWIINKKLN